MTKIKQLHRNSVGAVLDGVESNGFPGLVTAVGRMIGPNQPPIECFTQADVDFAGAQTAEQVWGAALGLAACLRNAKLEPEVPDPPPPPPPEPGRSHSLADVVLAALLVNLRDKGAKGEVQQYIQEPERV